MHQPGPVDGVSVITQVFLRVFGNSGKCGKRPGRNRPPGTVLLHDLQDPSNRYGYPSHPGEPHPY